MNFLYLNVLYLFYSYPLNKSRSLVASVKLLFTDCVEIQLASARILQR